MQSLSAEPETQRRWQGGAGKARENPGKTGGKGKRILAKRQRKSKRCITRRLLQEVQQKAHNNCILNGALSRCCLLRPRAPRAFHFSFLFSNPPSHHSPRRFKRSMFSTNCRQSQLLCLLNVVSSACPLRVCVMCNCITTRCRMQNGKMQGNSPAMPSLLRFTRLLGNA